MILHSIIIAFKNISHRLRGKQAIRAICDRRIAEGGVILELSGESRESRVFLRFTQLSTLNSGHSIYTPSRLSKFTSLIKIILPPPQAGEELRLCHG